MLISLSPSVERGFPQLFPMSACSMHVKQRSWCIEYRRHPCSDLESDFLSAERAGTFYVSKKQFDFELTQIFGWRGEREWKRRNDISMAYSFPSMTTKAIAPISTSHRSVGKIQDKSRIRSCASPTSNRAPMLQMSCVTTCSHRQRPVSSCQQRT